jgi:hypothetical protein
MSESGFGGDFPATTVPPARIGVGAASDAGRVGATATASAAPCR